MTNHELEKMYDILLPGWDADELDNRPRYRVFPWESGEHLGRAIYQGQPIACRLCGRDDRWTPEGECDDGLPRSWVCEHGTVSGVVRQFDSVPARLIVAWEVVE